MENEDKEFDENNLEEDEIKDISEDKLNESIKWMKNFALELSLKKFRYGKYITYEELMKAAKEHIEKEKIFHVGRYQDATSEEFWIHYQIITGEPI